MSEAREVFTIFTGQAGTQLASDFWKLLCYENGIDDEGYFLYCRRPSTNASYIPYFVPSQTEKLTPRTILIDSEPTVIDQIRTGSHKHFFDPESLITGKEDAAGNFAKGYFTIGKEMIENVLDRIRITCEKCSNLSGFIVFRSCGGGTGSGFTTLLLERLKEKYEKKIKIGYTIQINPPPNLSTEVLEVYNSILTIPKTMKYEDCCFVADNKALYDIYSKNLNIYNATYTDLNRLQAQIISGITALTRYQIIANLEELPKDLVPYPKLHFLLMAYAPIKAKCLEESVTDRTIECFRQANQLMTCDPQKGTYLSSYLIYRGNEESFSIYNAIKDLKEKKEIRCIDSNPECPLVQVNAQPAATLPSGKFSYAKKSILHLGNNTIISQTWNKIILSFNSMYKKRAFLHYYLDEGINQTDFEKARDDITNLEQNYTKLG